MGGVALLSGGLDSTVAAAQAVRSGGLHLALFVDYGQRSAEMERAASARIAGCLGIGHESVAVPFLGKMGRSALLDGGVSMPEPEAADLDDPDAMHTDARRVWVPNRNGLLINIAACFAENARAERVVVGFNAEEAVSFPDNSEEFLEASTNALSLSTANGVRVESPTAGHDKAGLIRLGLEVGAPLELIWSCYRSGESHCWRCPSCLRLKRALQRNDVYDDFLSGRPAREWTKEV